jgi:general secretion pathway protein J
MIAPQASEAGFTLVELLIGLALMALTAMLLLAGVSSARQALDYTERAGTTASMGAIQSYLRTTLSETHALPWQNNSAETEAPVFVGTKSRMSFSSGYVPRGQFGGLYRYELAVEPSAEPASAMDFVVAMTVHRPAKVSAPVATTRTTLVATVADLEFSYFVAENDDVAPTWRSTWSHNFRLPVLVAITVKFTDRDERTWPRLVVALPLSQR